MRRSRLLGLTSCMALLTASPSAPVAQEPQEQQAQQEREEEGVRLSLAQSLRTALENNLDLILERKEPQISELEIDVRQAKFDPVIGGEASFSRDSADSTITDNVVGGSTAGTSDSDVLNLSASWAQLLSYGGNYSVTLNRDDNDQSSRDVNTFTGFLQDRSFDSTQDGLSLHYEMPLLRGLGREVTTVDVLLARSGLDISRQDLRFRAIQTIRDVEYAYWDLLATREALRVARESLGLAEDLRELNRKKVDVGTLAPIEITQAEAGVASREEGVIVAETAVANAEDNLRRLLAIPRDDPAWSQTILPADLPQFEEVPVDTQAVLDAALENRPDVVTARQQLRDAELSERVAKNLVRHTLNLSADLNPNRADERFRQLVLSPPGIPPSDSTSESDGRLWRVGLLYGYPVRNREAKANYAIATLNREKSEVNVRNVELNVRVDVRTAVRNVESGIKRVAAARANSFLQRKTLEAEQKKFENGMSTSFEVLRIQTDLSNAQLAEIRAILDYNKALADLERAKGTLLEARGLRLETAPPPGG